jgi:adenosylcobalamin-dependent ribonucleoside-triphosphate reductase
MVFEAKERFHLTEGFLEQYKRKRPDWGPLGYVTYKRTYARIVPGTKRTEEWWETCRRVVEGCYTVQLNHCRTLRLPWNAHKSQHSAQQMYDLMFSFKFLPPGRGLWMMGTDYIFERGSGALNNCAFCSTENIKYDFTEPFVFLMDMSMLGVGVAFDTKGAGTVELVEPKVDSEETFVAHDSKEGWVSVVERLLLSYVGKAKLPKEFDYSQIRPSGEPIKTFGGVAPGPQPLMECMDTLHTVLKPYVGKQVDSTLIVDIMNILGKCVVSGGVRRTAELVLGDPEDTDYLQLKDPELHKEQNMAWRWASNNSVLAYEGMDYSKLGEQTAKNGEPGYVWLDHCQHYGRMKDGRGDHDLHVAGTNPCAEQSLESFEMCCLVETFPSRHGSLDDYLKTLKYAYLYGKTVTLIPTHNEKTNQIMLRNRRIGLSQSGIVESFQKIGRREHMHWCDEGYDYVKHLDQIYSSWLCVPESIKTTTVKPSGTVSLLPGVTPGIHYPHSEYYYRTIRIQRGSPLIKPLREAGHRIEKSQYGDNTHVVYFPVHEPNFDRAKEEVTIWEQLENAAQLQHYWSDNQVSVTVTFTKDEADDIPRALELYETQLKSVSFLPLKDHDYPQAPYQTIDKIEYEKAVNKIKTTKLRNLNTDEVTDNFCSNDTCEIGVGVNVNTKET